MRSPRLILLAIAAAGFLLAQFVQHQIEPTSVASENHVSQDVQERQPFALPTGQTESFAASEPTVQEHAARVMPVEEYATLVNKAQTKLGDKTCNSPAGHHVRIVSAITNLWAPNPANRVFVRMVSGPCLDYELTIDRSELTNFRGTFAPEKTGSLDPTIRVTSLQDKPYDTTMLPEPFPNADQPAQMGFEQASLLCAKLGLRLPSVQDVAHWAANHGALLASKEDARLWGREIQSNAVYLQRGLNTETVDFYLETKHFVPPSSPAVPNIGIWTSDERVLGGPQKARRYAFNPSTAVFTPVANTSALAVTCISKERAPTLQGI